MGITPKRKFNRAGTAAAVGALLCWTVSPLAIKELSFTMDFWTQNLFRYTAAWLVWVPYFLHARRSGRLNAGLWKRALLPAAANVVMQCFWTGSFYYLNPAFALLLTKASILSVAAFSIAVFPEEKNLVRSRGFWLGMVLCVGGVAGVIVSKPEFRIQDRQEGLVLGIVLALVCALLWGVYSVSSRACFKGVDARESFFAMSLYTVIGLGVLALLFGKPAEAFSQEPRAWVYIVVSGVVGIAFSHTLFYRSISKIGVTIPSLIQLLQPFTVYSFSAFLFDEKLTAIQMTFGLVLLLGGASAIRAQGHLKDIKDEG